MRIENNKQIRQNLAYAYQVLAKQKMDDLTYTHLSARSETGQSFFIYPFGLVFSEVTAENLLEVTFDGNIISGSEEQYNKTGYVIHGSIYKERQDINAIFHLHTTAGVAVSCMQFGLLPISQFSLHFYEKISYHDYDSLALDNEVSGAKLVKDLQQNKVVILRNHGTITCGSTVHEAMFFTHHLEQACKVQIQALSAGYSNLVFPKKKTCIKTVQDLLSFEEDLGARDWKAHLRQLNNNS